MSEASDHVFQSRNRESSDFNPAIAVVVDRAQGTFQSRNRESSDFNFEK